MNTLRLARTIAAVSVVYDVPSASIAGSTRERVATEARAVVAWILTRAFGWSLPRTGLYLCRHHTTILAAQRRIDAAIASSECVRARVSRTIRLMLQQSYATTHAGERAAGGAL